MARKQKRYEDDDGRTIVNMNVDGMPWYRPASDDRKKTDKEDAPKWKERMAMLRGVFVAYMPAFLAIMAGITLAFVFVYLWFKGWKL